MDEKMTSAKEAVRELTLALMFLTRFRTRRKKGQEEPWSAWKGYDFDAVDELMETDFIRGSVDQRGPKSADVPWKPHRLSACVAFMGIRSVRLARSAPPPLGYGRAQCPCRGETLHRVQRDFYAEPNAFI